MAKVTFKPLDVAEHLRSEEEIATFLGEVAESGDAAEMARALATAARARNMTELAQKAGLTRAGLYRALAPGANPSFATVAKIARALGVKIAFQPAAAE